MADDSREAPSITPPPPRAPANVMPGGTAHTAGGERANDHVSYVDVVRSLPADYYLNFHKRPCVRDSQLTAISSGFAGYMVGAVLSSTWINTRWCGLKGPQLTRGRAGVHLFELCGSGVVCDGLRALPGVPVLPAEGKGWHEASGRTDGEKARNHRSKERGTEKTARRIRKAGRGTAIRRTTEEVVGVLDEQERAVLVGAWLIQGYVQKRVWKRCTVIGIGTTVAA
jgi:hypothetical protein